MITREARAKATDGDGTPAWLERATAPERVEWAVEQFGDRLVLSTSFGIQSAVMLHLVTRCRRDMPVIFVDTGYCFAETYRYAEELRERLDLNLKIYRAHRSPAWQEAVEGRRWEGDMAALATYNRENKVEPMNRALRELGAVAWMSGLRRVQAQSRAERKVVERQQQTTKIHPILDWDERAVYQYMQEQDLPQHPLWERGYTSVGDWHSTRPLTPGMAAEETRFNGRKRECGLHEASGQADWQI